MATTAAVAATATTAATTSDAEQWQVHFYCIGTAPLLHFYCIGTAPLLHRRHSSVLQKEVADYSTVSELCGRTVTTRKQLRASAKIIRTPASFDAGCVDKSKGCVDKSKGYVDKSKGYVDKSQRWARLGCDETHR